MVGYAPIVDAKPSHIPDRSFSVKTMNQQLYCIAFIVYGIYRLIQQPHYATWWLSHTVLLYFGQLWGDVGLRDTLVDFGVYASDTVDQMLSGKQYKRAVRGLIYIFVLMRCYMMSFCGVV